ncbi:N-acetylglucosamine-6-phosphate deacetylase [Paracoccus sp. (in: a-proteobacteria)]|uniref:N-acetylglucosamine-6-phosphate deacetylase n=1 Tax=Paracoccus sp. TaxID=267 RepID=UPI0035B24D48
MTVLAAAQVFDGQRMLPDHAVVIEGDRIAAVLPASDVGPVTRLEGTLAPGFLDLQVNGGGGLMVGGDIDVADLRRICATHQRLGCAGVLPTLITDTPEATAAVIDAGIRAVGVPGFLGLHLEGPHLDPRRHGAHDPALIRPMEANDLARLCKAARALPVLMVTLAPEAATPDQIATLSRAGIIVSLGHTDCDHDTARAAFAAGACCATHLFNAMSQMGHRSPGLVGAVLAGDTHAGLIADAIHVHPAVLRTALAARPDGIFLVTDCMAFAGTDLTEMTLQGRTIHRRDGRLTLADGTLAGADLRMDGAIRVLVDQTGIAPERALAMATSEPARIIGLSDEYGALREGRRADLVLLDDGWRLQSVWIAGQPVTRE